MPMTTHKLIRLSLFGAMLLLLPLQAVQADRPSLASLQEQINQLQAQVNALQAQLGAVQGNSVLQLNGKLSLNTSDPARPTALFTGVNVQVVNGLYATASANNVGNLIVGYNEPFGTPARNGSHNIVLGPQHEYTSYGGFVAGLRNTISAMYAGVSGGFGNTASGNYASVSGGRNNIASGLYSSVSGGYGNTAFADYSAVLGGHTNLTGDPAKINHLIGQYSSVSGGGINTASGYSASVSGGRVNNASGGYGSSGSGGAENTTLADRPASAGATPTLPARASPASAGATRTTPAATTAACLAETPKTPQVLIKPFRHCRNVRSCGPRTGRCVRPIFFSGQPVGWGE